jgi:predicted negative regulator of RcsB-dependent stress response
MEIYSNDEQQVEALQRFLKENGLAIAAGLIIGFAGLFGFRQYQQHQLEQLEAQSAIYSQLLEESQKQDVDKEAWLVQAKKFVDENKTSSYAALTALLSAKEAVLKKDFVEAEKQLRWVATNSKEAEVVALAQLRLARVEAEQAKYKEALATLEVVMPTAFSAQQHELKGDVWLKSGDEVKAKAAYKAAQLVTEMGKNPLLDVKLNELAHVAG